MALSDTAIRKAKGRERPYRLTDERGLYHSRATVHGFRRTFSTLANEATKVVDGEEVPMWHPDWVERCLAHVPEDQVRAAYNAAEYLHWLH